MYIPLLQKPFRFCASYRLIIPAYPASVNRFLQKSRPHSRFTGSAGVRPDIRRLPPIRHRIRTGKSRRQRGQLQTLLPFLARGSRTTAWQCGQVR